VLIGTGAMRAVLSSGFWPAKQGHIGQLFTLSHSIVVIEAILPNTMFKTAQLHF
jgi:hypothetical protein